MSEHQLMDLLIKLSSNVNNFKQIFELNKHRFNVLQLHRDYPMFQTVIVDTINSKYSFHFSNRYYPEIYKYLYNTYCKP